MGPRAPPRQPLLLLRVRPSCCRAVWVLPKMQRGPTLVAQTLLLQDLRELQLYSHLHAPSLCALQIVFCAQKYNFKLSRQPSPGSFVSHLNKRSIC